MMFIKYLIWRYGVWRRYDLLVKLDGYWYWDSDSDSVSWPCWWGRMAPVHPGKWLIFEDGKMLYVNPPTDIESVEG